MTDYLRLHVKTKQKLLFELFVVKLNEAIKLAISAENQVGVDKK